MLAGTTPRICQSRVSNIGSLGPCTISLPKTLTPHPESGRKRRDDCPDRQYQRETGNFHLSAIACRCEADRRDDDIAGDLRRRDRSAPRRGLLPHLFEVALPFVPPSSPTARALHPLR